MISVIREKLLEVLRAVSPLLIAICVLQAVLVHAPLELFLQFLAGSALAILGMMLLFVGVDLGVLPMGKFIGAELPKKGSLLFIMVVAFAIAFATTIAEPDVLVLSGQVEAVSAGAISGRTVLLTIACGLGILVAVAMARIVLGWSMKAMLASAYVLVLVLALAAPAHIVPLAFDGGSVTTGVLSAPVVIAVALGVSSVLAGRSAVSDGFGLVGFASIGPAIAILIMEILR